MMRWILVRASPYAAFAAVAVVWTFPLVLRLSTDIPGTAAGDNVAVLWNFWWTRFAWARHLDLFRSDYLFAPIGTGLALHSNTLLPSVVGATLLGATPLVVAHNLVLLATLWLNGACTYVLLRRLTSDRVAAVAGAVTFAGSPFISAHLQGHLNVLSAWTLPLVAAAAIEARRGSRWWTVAMGLACGLTVYLDPYYALYAVGLGVVVLLTHGRAFTLAIDRPATRSAVRGWLLGLIAVDALVVALTLATGGFTLTLGSSVVRAHDPFNTLQLLWVLVAIWAWLEWRPRLTVATAPPATAAVWAAVATMVLTALVVASPVWIRVVAQAIAGDYISQTSHWRSGPQGIDLATLLMGSPYSQWMGDGPRRLYERFAIDPIERSAWLGLMPVGLALFGLRRGRASQVWPWLILGATALVWAMGPHLRLFGLNTGAMLPNALLRYLPVISNARVPGRAMVVVHLSLAALSALGLARARESANGRRWTPVLVAILLAELVPAPFPMTTLDRPPIYDALAAQHGPGGVLELPLGARDGFGERGRLDHRVLWYQALHERPLVGGFVARLAPSVRKAYDANPLVSDLLALSSGGALPPAPPRSTGETAEALDALGVGFVVLNRATASAALIDFVERHVPLVKIADIDGRTLYAVAMRPGR